MNQSVNLYQLAVKKHPEWFPQTALQAAIKYVQSHTRQPVYGSIWYSRIWRLRKKDRSFRDLVSKIRPKWYARNTVRQQFEEYVRTHKDKPSPTTNKVWYQRLASYHDHPETGRLLRDLRPHWLEGFGKKKESPIGKKFGKLTVLEICKKRHPDWIRGHYVRCRCDCGNMCVRHLNSLVKLSKIKANSSCGCANRRITVKAGDKYGDLTVIAEIHQKTSAKLPRKVICRCKCGVKTTVLLESLRGKNATRSCGCSRGWKVKSDLVGKVFGNLKIIKEMPQRGKRRVFKALCKCGKVSYPERASLINRGAKSCGCLRKPRKPTRTVCGGARFGQLVVIRDLIVNQKVKVRCDCGIVCVKNRNNLLGGITKSCGCGKYKGYIKRMLDVIPGTVFGLLSVIKEVERTTHRRFALKCVCGKNIVASLNHLRNRHTRSCGDYSHRDKRSLAI